MSKTILYRTLFSRAALALEGGYHLEACWIYYAIIEDRLNSIIRHAYPEKGVEFLKTLRGIDNKIAHIKNKLHVSDEDCRKKVDNNILDEIIGWKNKRNVLMHDIADCSDFDSLQARVMLLSKDSGRIVNDLCEATRKYKYCVKKRSFVK